MSSWAILRIFATGRNFVQSCSKEATVEKSIFVWAVTFVPNSDRHLESDTGKELLERINTSDDVSSLLGL